MRLAAAAVFVLAVLASAGGASPAPAPPPSAQQAIDEATVRAAAAAGGFQGLAAHLDALRAVLDHAPARYPRVEARGNLTIVRDEEVAPGLDLALLLTAAPARGDTRLRREFNTYGDAAFLLAAYANEMRAPDKALAFADRGLTLQPDNAQLVTEKTAALEALGRPADALAATERWAATKPEASDRDRARVLRAKGYALVELRRLDEGQTAYEASLKLEPDQEAAQNELAFIAQARKGLSLGGPSILTTPEKASDGGYRKTRPN